MAMMAVGWSLGAKPVLDSGHFTTAQSGVGALAVAISTYKFKLGSYPDALKTLTSSANGGPWVTEDALKDPWDKDYKYESDKTNFAVWSCGPDGASNSSISAISGDDIGVISH